MIIEAVVKLSEVENAPQNRCDTPVAVSSVVAWLHCQQNKERKFDNHERRYRHDVRNKRLPAPIDKIASSNALSVRDNCAARLVAEHACLEQDVSEKHKGC